MQESSLVKQRKHEERWAAYEARSIQPRVFNAHTNTVTALAVGLDGNICSGSHNSRNNRSRCGLV